MLAQHHAGEHPPAMAMKNSPVGDHCTSCTGPSLGSGTVTASSALQEARQGLGSWPRIPRWE
jgi:hypothetical protein